MNTPLCSRSHASRLPLSQLTAVLKIIRIACLQIELCHNRIIISALICSQVGTYIYIYIYIYILTGGLRALCLTIHLATCLKFHVIMVYIQQLYTYCVCMHIQSNIMRYLVLFALRASNLSHASNSQSLFCNSSDHSVFGIKSALL